MMKVTGSTELLRSDMDLADGSMSATVYIPQPLAELVRAEQARTGAKISTMVQRALALYFQTQDGDHG